MAKITITGDSFDEIQAVLDTVYSRAEAVEAVLAPQQAQQTYDPHVVAQQAQQAQPELQAAPAPAEPPKRTRARKTAEAPAPVQPETAPEQTQAASPFAANTGSPFAPAPDPALNGHSERAAIAKLKAHLAALAAAHGEGQVYSWAIQNAFNLPVETTKDVFLNEKIYDFTDDRLEAAYRMSGGQ